MDLVDEPTGDSDSAEMILLVEYLLHLNINWL